MTETKLDNVGPNQMLYRFLDRFTQYGGYRIYAAFGLTLVTGVLSSLSLLLIMPLLALAGIDTGGPAAAWTSWFREFATGIGVQPDLAAVLLMFVVIIGLQALLTQLSNQFNFELRTGFIDFIRLRLYRAVTASRWDFYISQRRSDIIYALNNEIGRLTLATYAGIQIVTSSIIGLFYAGFAAFNWPTFTFAALVGALLIQLPLRLVQRRAEAHGSSVLDSGRRAFGASEEHLASFHLAKAHGLHDRELKRFAASLHTSRTAQNKQMRLQTLVQAATRIAQAALLAALVWFAVQRLALSAAELLTLIYITMRIVPMLTQILNQWHQLRYLLPAFRSLEQLQADCEMAAETLYPITTAIPLRQGIALDNVSFSYGGADKTPILKNISIDIPAREITALRGASGAGKSTLGALVMGLLEPNEGSILIDGKRLAGERLAAWRSSIAWVPQNQYLFHTTVRENVRWMKLDADDSEVWSALTAASADTFVRNLPLQLDTVVGDAGIRLSGGERQRIAIARALLRKPELLVLDEATSELDSQTESAIQLLLKQLRGQITVLVIAHRQSSLDIADGIYEISNGRVVNQATQTEQSSNTW